MSETITPIEVALRTQEEFLRSIYEGVEEAIFVVDVSETGEFRFVSSNPAHERVTGISSSWIQGKTLQESQIPAWESVHQHYQDCVAAGITISYEENLVLQGKTTWWYTTLTPLKDGFSRIYRIIGTTINTTLLKQTERVLKQTLNQLRLHFENSPLAIIQWDNRGRIQRWSKHAEQIFGWSAEEVINFTFWDLNFIYEADANRVNSALVLLLEGRISSLSLENRNYRKDGSLIDCAWYNSAVFDEFGEIGTILSFAQDITERKKAEAELQKAKEAAEAANQAKSIFLANMSHELRTPLNAILGFTQLMAQDPQATQQQQDYLQIINQSGEYLLHLINDILDMSKIEAGKLVLNPTDFNLYHLLEALQSLFKFKAESKGLKLRFEIDNNIPKYILADANRLRQVIINILDNAIKFTQKGSIILRVTQGIKSNSRLLKFIIKDTGIGIAPEEINTIFTPFVQAQNNQFSQAGTGLGLTISRRLVEFMGGEIKAHSQLGVGTIFTFTIQFSLGKAVETSQFYSQIIGLAPNQPIYRILIVDDEETIRLLLFNILAPLGFWVEAAENGQQAIACWQSWEPHLIWMDMKMPILDGIAATRSIKATPKGQQTKIIALSASSFENQRSQILEAGCDDFVSKPFREEIILEKIAQHLGVSYVYAEKLTCSLPVSQSQKLMAKDLQVMPRKWIADLHQAALQVNAKRIEQLFPQIPESEANLRQALTHLVRNYRFDRLVDLTDESHHAPQFPKG